MNAIPAQLEIRLQHPKGWADCQTVIKRAFVINSKTDKSFLNKKFYENWCNLEIIDRRNYIITPIFGFTKISPFKRYFLLKTLLSVLGYMQEWGRCTPFLTRFLAVYWLKKSFLSKVKDMDDRGISTYVLRFFNFSAANTQFLKICRNGVHVPHSLRGFMLLIG